MKKILVLGAGKSATTLIHYLLEHADTYDWQVIVGDYSLEIAERKVDNHARGKAVFFDVNDAELRAKYVADADVVASVLPAKFHYLVAQDCLRLGKHIITPSYVSTSEKAMHADFEAAGLLFMGEIGLDPGIDHMSLMKMIGDITQKGGNITAIRSFTGALIAPESDTNPWHYKFTWAPMNVVLAGQGTAQYLKNGLPRYVPYNRLFSFTEVHEVEGYGKFEAYANRDSLLYLDKYNIPEVPTFVRGTFRKAGYCPSWNALVQLGLTDNNIDIINAKNLSYKQFVDAFIPFKKGDETKSIDVRLADFLDVAIDSEVMNNLRWLELLSDRPIVLKKATPAEILLQLLEEKWKLSAEDKDMIVMLHKIDYELNGEQREHTSALVMKGKNADETALAATVGLPMAMMAKLILNNEINLTGVHIPIVAQVYEPILAELQNYGVTFNNKDEAISSKAVEA